MNERQLRALLGAFILGMPGMGTGSATQAAEIEWINTAGGSWNAPENWDLNRLPTAEDAVRISAPGTYTVTLTAGISVGSLVVGGIESAPTLANNNRSISIGAESVIEQGAKFIFSAGTLSGTGNLIIRGALEWTSGTMSGGARTVIAESGVATLMGFSAGLDGGRVLENRGKIVWEGGHIDLNAGPISGAGRIENAPSGVIDVRPRGFWIWATWVDTVPGPLPSVTNNGTIRQTGGTFAAVNVAFENNGTVETQTGTLLFSEPGINRGRLVAALGAEMILDNAVFEDGTSFAGEGTFAFDGGVLTFNADLSIPNSRFMGGQIAGLGTVTITQSMNWTGGTMIEEGRTVIGPGATLRISGTVLKGLDRGRVLENHGLIVWSGGFFDLNATAQGGPGRIENASDGVFDADPGGIITASSPADVGTGLPAGFYNAGRIRKPTGIGRATITAPFINTGSVDVGVGILRLNGNGRTLGTMTVGAGAFIWFENFTFEAEGSLAGDGRHVFMAGIQTLNTHQSIPHLEMTGGQMVGPGGVTITGDMLWSGGVMAGSTTTLIAPGAVLSVNGAAKMDSGRVLENRGEIRMLGGSIDPNGANVSPLPKVINAGTLRGTIETGTAAITTNFENAGRVEALTGTLRLGMGRNSGLMTAAAGATIAYETILFGPGSTLEGAGLFLFDAGIQAFDVDLSIPNVRLSGGQFGGRGVVTISNSLHWSGGVMSGAGRTIISQGVTATLDGTNEKALDSGRVFENRGTVVWTAGNINLNGLTTGGSGRIENAASGVFEARVSAAYLLARATTDVNTAPLPSFLNLGVLRKTPTSGGISIAVPVTNVGLFDIQQTSVSVNSPLTFDPLGRVRIEIGRALASTRAGHLIVTGAAEIDGGLEVQLLDGVAPAEGTQFVIVTTGGSRNGVFRTVTGGAASGGLYLNPIYEARGVKLMAQSSLARIDAQPGRAGTFQIGGIVGQSYRIDSTTSLQDGDWRVEGAYVMPPEGFLDFVDNESPLPPYKFYRAIFVQP